MTQITFDDKSKLDNDSGNGLMPLGINQAFTKVNVDLNLYVTHMASLSLWISLCCDSFVPFLGEIYT